MQWFFVFFLISGFCSVLYELVWLRLAMAQYGVTTPLVSLVLSTFMLGLGLGSWGAGRLVRKLRKRLPFSPSLLYALIEVLIGVSAIIVPLEFSWGRAILERLETHGLSSSGYYLAAGAWIALSLVPWCACMGATFPIAMFAIEDRRSGANPSNSFSYLYLANVLGAVAGAWIPLFFIESLGFHKTLQFGSALNFILAASVTILTLVERANDPGMSRRTESPRLPPADSSLNNRKVLFLLCGTGVTSMAVEVVWVRMFTPWLGTVVYAFAAILVSYLGATYVGSLMYRMRAFRPNLGGSLVWVLLGFTIFLPMLGADPRIPIDRALRLAIAVVPLSGVVGFLTPMMVDWFSSGDGELAGRSYAVNVIGCILGPLLAGFVLLPSVGERGALCVLAVPWFVIGLSRAKLPVFSRGSSTSEKPGLISGALVLISVVVFLRTSSFEEQFSHRWVRRDYTATVVAKGDARLEKRLLVNGSGMTGMRPITKMMAHLPLAMLSRKPTNILIICFGMGTTHRSALSWGISSTVVELVPSVPKVYGYFHEDGPKLLQSPMSHLVIDDGRLFLERTTDQYDVITIDPPPPVEAAGSSLLYSKEFYALVKRHLRPGGILQQWFPGGEPIVQSSVTKALQQSFPNVRVFRSIMDYGFHFLATMSPIPSTTPSVLAERMPPTAVADMLEWGPESSAEQQFSAALSRELEVDHMIQPSLDAPVMEDDRPVNEYYFMRHHSTIFGWALSGSLQ